MLNCVFQRRVPGGLGFVLVLVEEQEDSPAPNVEEIEVSIDFSFLIDFTNLFTDISIFMQF